MHCTKDLHKIHSKELRRPRKIFLGKYTENPGNLPAQKMGDETLILIVLVCEKSVVKIKWISHTRLLTGFFACSFTHFQVSLIQNFLEIAVSLF